MIDIYGVMESSDKLYEIILIPLILSVLFAIQACNDNA